MYKSYYKYQQWKPLSCYPRVWNRYPTYFQNVYERVHFWTFQHPNKKVWKYELLTPKTREVRMMWTGWRFFLNFSEIRGVLAMNYLYGHLSVQPDYWPPCFWKKWKKSEPGPEHVKRMVSGPFWWRKVAHRHPLDEFMHQLFAQLLRSSELWYFSCRDFPLFGITGTAIRKYRKILYHVFRSTNTLVNIYFLFINRRILIVKNRILN